MRRGSVFWGTLFILAGLVFLIGSIWGVNVWQFVWPLFLIIAGIWVLWSALRGPSNVERASLFLPLKGESEARIHIQYGAGRLSIGGDAAPGRLLEGEFAGGVRHSRHRTGERADIRIRGQEAVWSWMVWAPHARDWSMRLTHEIPLRLEIDTGASDARLDLRPLRIVELDLDTGASSTEIWLPEAAGQTHVKIDAGAASVTLRVPENVAARIETDMALGSVNVDRQRFPRTGKIYESPDYATAEHRVAIRAEGGVGSLTVR